MSYAEQYDPKAGVAIVGMAGRFPGAADVQSLWSLLQAGRSGIRCFAADELEPSFAEDMQARLEPGYVPARGILNGVDLFDEGFFGFSPAEAALLDPQHRLFLQTSWAALEDAAHDPAGFDGLIGVYAGGTANSYYLNNLQSRPDVTGKLGLLTTQMANQGHYIATRTAYKLDLRGPALNIHTACSTSLVAVCTAVHSLLSFQCDMALAGGVSVTLPQRRGYRFQEGSILSPDGQCRPFDADAAGTVFSNGLGVVVLRRLADALADRDRIYAVIKGVALNNDGHAKLSFTAPSVAGQAECIAMAQAMAGIDPQTLQYVEAHGTGTALGDPIEVQALTQAFRAGGADGTGFCALGSLKATLGHLDAAAGVAGLIRTALALHHQQLPGQPNYSAPHPRLELESSPFVIHAQPQPWLRGPGPRRAAVSSLGVGGTNAHVVLEEAPILPLAPSATSATSAPSATSATSATSDSGQAGGSRLILVSARDAASLQRAQLQLADALEALPGSALAAAAQTLHTGRRAFAQRHAVVADSPQAAAQRLRAAAASPQSHSHSAQDGLNLALLFAGQGSQRVNAWRSVYERERVFRDELDRCAASLQPHLGADLREWLFPEPNAQDEAQALLDQTRWTQPALVSLQLAASRLYAHWGLHAAALLGHSVGEWTAACLSGCFTRDDALALVAQRGKLMQAQPMGVMLAVRASAAELQAELSPMVAMAACNAPRLNVLSGPADAMAVVAERLQRRGCTFRRLATSHAFHSPMMDPVLSGFEACVAKVARRAPGLPWISGLTGDWITAEQAQSPAYWARQLREAVQFSDGVSRLLDSGFALLDIGPGDGLARLARQQPGAHRSPLIVSAMRLPERNGEAEGKAEADDHEQALAAAGALWSAGLPLNAAALHPGPTSRISLPSYPFAAHRHWVEPAVPPLPLAVSLPLATVAVPEVPVTAPSPNYAATTPNFATSPMHAAVSVSQVITTQLQTLVADLCGLEPSAVDANARFLELGLDSLALTQLAQAVHKQWGVRLPLRKLLEELDCVQAVVTHLAPHLAPQVKLDAADPTPPAQPAEMPATGFAAARLGATGSVASAVATAAESAVSVGSASAGPSPALAELIAQQLALMQRQLDLLRGNGGPLPGTQSLAMVEPVPADERTKLQVQPTRAVAASAKSESFGPYRPPATARAAQPLTAQQSQGLKAFIARYTAHTAQSKQHTQSSRAVLADPRSVAGYRQWSKELVYPLVTRRSAGSRLWDVDGHELIDITNGFGMVMFGHNPDFLREALHTQIEQGYEIGPQSPMAGEVAAALCDMVGLERAAFCSTGSEAVMAALRIARTVTGRDTVVMFAGAYHGVFDEALVRGGATASAPAQPIAPGIPASMAANVVVLDYGSDASLAIIRRLGGQLAAVLVEPVQSRRPELQPREFLLQLRQITEACGAALVFDEVVTGFRVHPGGAQALFGVRADIATYGKVLGGGLPIGVIAGSARFLDALDGGAWQFGDDSAPEVGVTFFAGTFVRHPLALAAARAVLAQLKREGPALQRQLNQRTTHLVQELRDTAQTLGAPLTVAHFSSWFCMRWPSDMPWASLFFAALRLHGLHVWEGRPCFLTTAHSDDDLQRVVQIVRTAIIELQQAGLLPAPAHELAGSATEVSPAASGAAQAPAERPSAGVADSARQAAFDEPPVPGARRGRDREGREAWFVADPQRPGKFLQVLSTGAAMRRSTE